MRSRAKREKVYLKCRLEHNTDVQSTDTLTMVYYGKNTELNFSASNGCHEMLIWQDYIILHGKFIRQWIEDALWALHTQLAWDSDAARRRRQAEELAERGIFVGEFAEGAQAKAVRNALQPHQESPSDPVTVHNQDMYIQIWVIFDQTRNNWNIFRCWTTNYWTVLCHLRTALLQPSS